MPPTHNHHQLLQDFRTASNDYMRQLMAGEEVQLAPEDGIHTHTLTHTVTHTHAHTHTCTYVHVYIYMCILTGGWGEWW